MVITNGHISSQYLRKEDISVTLIEVKNPGHYVVKESPCYKAPSEANKFMEMEGAMQEYYNSFQKAFCQLPMKDSIVVAKYKNKFYRGQVQAILNSSTEHFIKVYLLDYGRECSVSRDCWFEIQSDFLRHPFQAVDFKLLDVEPISLLVSPLDLTLEYGLVETWDTSATAYIQDLFKVTNNIHISVKGFGKTAAYGSLYVTMDNNEVKCINEVLVLRKFARRKADCWDEVKSIDCLLRDFIVQHNMNSCPAVEKNESSPPMKTQTTLSVVDKVENIVNSQLVAKASSNSEKTSASPINKLLRYQTLIKPPTKTEEASKIDCAKEEQTIAVIEVCAESKVEEQCSENSPKSNLEKLLAFYNKKSSPQKQEAAASKEEPSNNSPAYDKLQNAQNTSETPLTNQNEAAQNESLKDTPNSNPNAVRNYLYRKNLFDSKPDAAAQTTIETKSNSALELDSLKNKVGKSDAASAELVSAMNDMDLESNSNYKFSNFDDLEDPLQYALCPNEVELQLSESASPPSSRRSSLNSDSQTEVPLAAKPDFSSKSIWEKQKVPALCLGDAVPKPILTTGDASFPPALEKTLQNLNFCGPSCIQSVVWPAVLRSRSLAAVAPPYAGKTVSYALPIVANFLSQISYVDLPHTKGPIAIILCSSWKKVQAVFDLLKLFLGDAKVKIISFFANGRNKREKLGALLNGCEILISVPKCLIDFFKDDLVCLKRLCHFILDDGNNLLTYNMTELKEIMLQLGKVIGLRPMVALTLQVVICTERWTKRAASFVSKFMPNPLLLFTSFLEAAIYAEVPLHAHLCDDSQKKKKLLDILEHARRTVICTTSSAKASEIHSFLKCENVRSFLVTEKMEHFISNGVIQDWKSIQSFAAPHCLVMTDSASTHMSISNANYLIHYDVPEMSRLQFGNRFSCIAEHFADSTSSAGCVCHILISGDCLRQASSLLKLIKRSGTEIPEQLKELAAKHRQFEKSSNIPLCHYMKAFGSCSTPNCPQRHHIDSAVDQPSVIPSSGDIHARVTHVCDASHLYVRVLKYISPDIEQPSSMSGAYVKIGFQMKKFFSVESNRVEVKVPVAGESYVLKENTLYYRVKILEILPATQSKRSRLKLLFRDEGWVQFLESYQLYQYLEPDLFPPPLALEVYLCNVNTPDTCPDWNPQANRFISELISNREVDGKIVLCLGETVWLHPMAVREKLIFTNDYLNVLTVDKRLKGADFAVENKQHLPLLFAASKNKIALPKVIKPPAIAEEPVDEPSPTSHAFLELNVCEEVYISSIVSPHQFYVQRAKFVDCLDKMLDEIGAKIEANTLQTCKILYKGMHCIAPFSEDKLYYRAIVTDIILEGDMAQLFFVDFGDSGRASKDCIFELPSELLLLPFQAIECELDGIKAPHGGWTDQAEDALYHLTRDDNGDMKVLQLKAHTKSKCYDGGNHYIVDICCDDISFSQHLLEAGLVLPGDRSTVPVEYWEEDTKIEEEPKGFAASSNEEELDEEDKAIEAIFCAKLSKLMLESFSGKPSHGLDIIQEANENAVEERKAKKVNGMFELVEEDIGLEPSVSNSPLQALQRLLMRTTVKDEVKRPKPFLTWWDDLSQLFILINLLDVQLYELNVCDNMFTFKSSLRGVEYFCEEELFAPVLSNEAEHKVEINGVKITLKKQEPVRWQRLTKSNTKFPHIKYNLNHLDDSDSEPSREEVPVAVNNQNDKVLPYLSDEESSNSSSDEDNTLSWRALLKDKDPYNPLD